MEQINNKAINLNMALNKTTSTDSIELTPKNDADEETATDAATTQHLTSIRQKLKDVGSLTRADFDGGPVSLNEIEPGLFLGNLTAATHTETLKSFKITHILTLDSVPLPQHIVEATFLTTKYVQIADMPKEDILHHLDQCVEFISEALAQNGNVLVHCYFGVSRSSSVVIAYIMKQHNIDYQQAYELVKSKRRFVQPNSGFIAQLKLYRRMGCKIDGSYQKYKLYRLRLAGEQVRKAKILPQSFNNLIKPDPGITQENPDPIVYRCRKCRRILVNRSHVLVHKPKNSVANVYDSKNPTDNVATKADGGATTTTTATTTVAAATQTAPRLLEQIASQIRKISLNSPIADGNVIIDETVDGAASIICGNIIFVEPIAWMQHITHNTQGRLLCPKCEQKLGNFSWINGCQCPCGETMTPAFYMIPSKVELSKAVQNVQTTV